MPLFAAAQLELMPAQAQHLVLSRRVSLPVQDLLPLQGCNESPASHPHPWHVHASLSPLLLPPSPLLFLATSPPTAARADGVWLCRRLRTWILHCLFSPRSRRAWMRRPAPSTAAWAIGRMGTEAATAMMLGAHEKMTARCAAAIGGRGYSASTSPLIAARHDKSTTARCGASASPSIPMRGDDGRMRHRRRRP